MTNMKLALCLVVLMAVCASARHSRRHPTSSPDESNSTSSMGADTEWDFYILRVEWAGGYQSDTWPTCVKTWTLHGLWPTRNDTTYPETCNTTPFDISKLSNVTGVMACSWPSCCGSNSDFWKHEWSKHGTCAMTNKYTSDIEQYFGAALTLLDKYPIYSYLEDADITPSYSRSYTASEIRSTLQSAMRVTPVLTCQSSRIISIDLCISKSLQMYQCNADFMKDDNCGSGTVWYNPPKYQS